MVLVIQPCPTVTLSVHRYPQWLRFPPSSSILRWGVMNGPSWLEPIQTASLARCWPLLLRQTLSRVPGRRSKKLSNLTLCPWLQIQPKCSLFHLYILSSKHSGCPRAQLTSRSLLRPQLLVLPRNTGFCIGIRSHSCLMVSRAPTAPHRSSTKGVSAPAP